MKPPIVLHCALTREDHGSVPYLLAYHHRHDAENGFAPRFMSFFDRQSTWAGDCATLAGHGWETVGALRRRFATQASARPVDVAIYHDGWGLNWFAPVDGATRRVLFLQTERPHTDALLRSYAPQVDGIIAISKGLAERVRCVLPDFPAERIRTMSLFFDAPGRVMPERPPGPMRFGYSGRIVREQKRLERLPALLAALDQKGFDYVFDVMGSGSFLGELKHLVRHHPRVRFIPWQQGEDYWRTLAGWRAIVLLSDFEGFSRAMVDGVMAGALPVHPDFSPAAGELLGPAAPLGLYPVGDMAAAADRLAALARLSLDENAALSAACRTHLSHLTPANYFAEFGRFIREVLAAPPRARLMAPPVWQDWLLLGVYTRLFPRRF